MDEKIVVLKGKPKKKSRKKSSESGMGTFAPNAYWRILDTDVEPMKEPENPTFRNAHAPTIEKRDAMFVPMKFGFSKYKFTVPEFNACVEREQRWTNGRIKKNKNGTVMTEKTPRETGCVDPSFIKLHNLTPKSRPDHYVDILLPMKKNTHNGKERISFWMMKDWTNLKASLADAGKDGSCYRDFVDFTTEKLRQHFGLYVLQGLCPSPRIEMKFHSKSQDKTHGNDLVYRSFGANAERRHRHFKAFLACQDPRIFPPNQDEEPNWKVRPLITWMNFIFPNIWPLSRAFSVDEMTMGFKGQHRDKKE